jgi:outer membrane protein TolC
MKWKQIINNLIVISTFITFTSINAQQLAPELKELIHKGISKGFNIKEYQIASEQAKIDQKMAKAVFIPKITLNGSYSRLNDDIRFDDQTNNLLIATQKLLIKEAIGIPFNTPLPNTVPIQEIPSLQSKNIFKSAIDLDWVLFSGFKATNAIKASKHKEKSFHFLAKAESDKTALKIIENYDKLALVNASKEVLSATENYLNEQFYFVQKAIKNGLATPIDRRKIELAQQQLKSKQIEYNHNKELIINVLQQLTGESIDRLKLMQPNLTPIVIDSTKLNIRNEISALNEAEKATWYKAKMEKSNFIPKIALKGHYELLKDDLSIFDPEWYVGVGIKWHVFDGFESKLKAKKALLENEKYKRKKENAKELIQLSITKASLDQKLAIQQIAIAKKQVALAKITYKMVEKQYKNGLASITDVLNALRDLEKANFDLQKAYFKQRRTAIDLAYAKGILNY